MIRQSIVSLVWFILSLCAAQAQILTSPCQAVGGQCVGAQGAAGTIYAGHILSWGESFPESSPNVVGPQAPLAKYFPVKSYNAGPRGSFTILGPAYDTDQLNTGYNDSNRGVPVGWANMNQAPGTLTLQARNATAGEQSNMYLTSQNINTVTPGVRPQVTAAIHSDGAVGWYPSNTGSVIVEARMQYTGNGQLGWHPDFWVNSSNPVNETANPGLFDSLNACEGNSTTCNSSINQFTNGALAIAATGSNFTDLYGAFHTLTFELNGGAGAHTKVDVDGTIKNDMAVTSNFASKPQFFLITSHIFSQQSWLGESYNQASWNSTGANIKVQWVRVWRPVGTAKHWVPLQTIPDIKVPYNGTATYTFPSALAMCGDAGVSEYIQAIPMEPNEPGMGFNNLYNQFPPGVSYNSGTRVLTVDFSAVPYSQGSLNAGVLHMVYKCWKPDGSTFQPARFTIYRGPRPVTRGGNITLNSSSSVDVYASCDVGIATPKTVSIVGAPAGMNYSSSTGLETGTPTAGSTATVTCTNNVGQSVSYPLIFGPLQNETYALEQRMTNLPSATTEAAIDTAISSLKTDGLRSNLFSFSFMGLGDSQASLLNWLGDYWNPSLINTPTFSAYNGFTTNGVTGGSGNGIDTGFDAAQYTAINALAFSVLSNTSGQVASGGLGYLNVGGTAGFTMTPRNTSDQFAYRANDGTAATIANTSGNGFFTGMRSGATTKKAFLNGVQIGTTLNTASTTLISPAEIEIGQIGGGGTSAAARQWEAYAIRKGSFTDVDEANLAAIVNTLAASVGP